MERSFTAPSPAHPFGTDEMGRDILSRVFHGARASVLTEKEKEHVQASTARDR